MSGKFLRVRFSDQVLQVMDLVLEEEFLEILVHFFKTLPMDDIWQTNSKQGSKDVRDQETEISQSLHVSLKTPAWSQQLSSNILHILTL